MTKLHQLLTKSRLRMKRAGIVSYFAATMILAALVLRGDSAAQTVSALYTFQEGSDGGGPLAPVIADGNGNLFGTTSFAGNTRCSEEGGAGCGTIFEVAAPPQPGGSWSFAALYTFMGGSDGCCQSGTLALDAAGNLYGATAEGVGTPNESVFQLAAPGTKGGQWTFNLIYTFQNQGDGELPITPLAIDGAGNIYGIAIGEPSCKLPGCQTVFQLSPPAIPGDAWTETTLYAFKGKNDGGSPNRLLLDSSGALYGTTTLGGSHKNCPKGCGVVFKVTPSGGAWAYSVLYRFKGKPDAASPFSLIEDSNGSLYGIACCHGGSGETSIFKLNPPDTHHHKWYPTYIHAFSNNGSPPSYLTAGQNGVLYGSIFGDIDIDAGAVFQLTPPVPPSKAWSFTTLADINQTGPSRNPNGVVLGAFGALYGTQSGGDSDAGDVFELVP